LEWLFIALIGLVLVSLVVLILYVVLANRRQRARMVQAHEADKITPRPALQVAGQVLSLVRDEEGEALKVEVHGTSIAVGRRSKTADQTPGCGCRLRVDPVYRCIGEDAVSPVPIEKHTAGVRTCGKDSQAQVERIRHASVAKAPGPGAARTEGG